MGNNYVSGGAVLARLERGVCRIIVSFCRDRAKGAWEDVANGMRPASFLSIAILEAGLCPYIAGPALAAS